MSRCSLATAFLLSGLATTAADGSSRVGIAGKEGMLASVDRSTHEPVFNIPITTIFNADKQPTPEGIRACPGVLGGVEWNGPSYDPASRTIHVGSVDWCATYIRDGAYEYVAGELYMGTGYRPDPSEEARGWLHAVAADDGTVRWKYSSDSPMIAGVTPTAGGVLFTGDLAGGVITYAVDSVQYVALASGNVSRGTFNTWGSPKVMVWALDAPDEEFYRVALPEANGRGMVALQPPEVRGEMVFGSFCSACHGARGEQGVVQSDKRTLESVAAFIRNPTGEMPQLWPVPLDEAEVQAVATYVLKLQAGEEE